VHIDTEPVTVTLPVVEMTDPEPEPAEECRAIYIFAVCVLRLKIIL
jgi:hypothetical protein